MSTRGWETVTPQDVTRRELKQATMPQKRRSKYNARKTTVDGIVFDSAKEAKRYGELLVMGSAGVIRNLELQPFWAIRVTALDAPVTWFIGTYKADFRYEREDPFADRWDDVIEDVKGMKTPVYRLKKKIVEALYGIQIREI